MEKVALDAVTAYLQDLLHMTMLVCRKDARDPEAIPAMEFAPTRNNPLYQRNFAQRYMIFREDKMVSYYVSDDDVAFGCINDMKGEYYVYVGPCLLSDLTDQLVDAMITRENSPFFKEPEKYREQIYSFLRQLPRFTQEEFLSLIAFGNTCINHTVLSPDDFYAVPLSKRKLDLKTARIRDVREEETDDTDPTQEIITLFRSAIQNGDTDEVEERWLHLSPKLMRRLLASGDGIEDTFLRAQHSFIRTLTMLETEARSAGAGETAVRNISWKYTRSAEEAIVRKQLEMLYKQAMLAYAEAVASRKEDNPQGNRIIAKAMEIVDSRITEPISSNEIAEELGLSPGYFSAAFHRESGMTVTAYIQNAKIRVAQELLSDTDESIGEISSYLGYSSQSHFQNVFKKITGVTPLSYRKRPMKEANVEK